LVTSSMDRLTHLIEKAEPILQASQSAKPSEPFPSPQPVTDHAEPPGSIKIREETDDDLPQND
jgi:hypothetical protein